MTSAALEAALRFFARRRRIRFFWLAFFSGDRIKVTHPEAVRRIGELFAHRGPDDAYRLFAADSVCQLLEEPTENR